MSILHFKYFQIKVCTNKITLYLNFETFLSISMRVFNNILQVSQNVYLVDGHTNCQ